MVTTSGRTRGRQSARSGAPGPAAEHRSKIMAVLATGVVVIVLVLSMTSEGHVIDAAVQHFMLYYAGVFALIGLTAAVGIGLVATDRIVMTPGHRVMAQAVHRAVSFGALAFLIIHIVTEILAQRAHVIDAVVPFLSPFRTFYIGLGTIASDLIILLVITSIFRKRFTGHGKAWRWRAIHYSAYVAFVFGILHGLLGGRPGKPYVDWSYGFAIAFTALGIAVRILALRLRPKETMPVPPTTGKSGTSSSPLHAAALTMAQSQLGGTIQSLPVGAGMQQGMQPAGMALPAAPAMQLPPGSSYGGYGDGGFTPPLGAPPYGEGGSYGDMPYGERPSHPYQQPAVASLPAPPPDTRQPLYEPGYIGPPRYEGAPRSATGPIPRAATGPMPTMAMDSAPRPRPDSGPIPRLGTGPRPRIDTGAMPRIDPGPPAVPPAPSSRGGTGPRPIQGTQPIQRPQQGTGPRPRPGTGPVPSMQPAPVASRPATGPLPRLDPPWGPPPPGQDLPSAPRGGTGPMTPPGGNGRRPRPPANQPQDRDRPQAGGDRWR